MKKIFFITAFVVASITLSAQNNTYNNPFGIGIASPIATCNELIKSIEVYTNNGILVFSDNNLETRDYNLDLSKVKSGNYLLVINGTETKKIIKL